MYNKGVKYTDSKIALENYGVPSIPTLNERGEVARQDYHDFLGRKTPLLIASPLGVTIYTYDKVGVYRPPIIYKWFGNGKK